MPDALDEMPASSSTARSAPERAELVDTDVLVWNQLEFTPRGRAAIEADPLFQQLDAMQEGRALFIDGVLDDALQFNTVLSQPFLLEEVVPMLEQPQTPTPPPRRAGARLTPI